MFNVPPPLNLLSKKLPTKVEFFEVKVPDPVKRFLIHRPFF
jgi:hypothetical protein